MSYHGVVNPAAHQTHPWIQSPSQQLSFDQCSLQYKLTWISDAILDIKCPNFLQQSELILHFWRRPTCQTPNNSCSNSCIQKLSSEINYFIKTCQDEGVITDCVAQYPVSDPTTMLNFKLLDHVVLANLSTFQQHLRIPFKFTQELTFTSFHIFVGFYW